MGKIINISGEEFRLIDGLENISVVDSFVKINKIGRGAGEARLYIGPQRSRRDFQKFFNNFEDKCFFVKRDLRGYLEDAKFEYENQEQGYQKNISGYWSEYVRELKGFDERIYFTVESALGERDQSRYYIRSYDKIFHGYFREIALPSITYLSILKLRNREGKYFFYFRPFLNYFYNPLYHPARIKQEEKVIEGSKTIEPAEKEQLVKARTGQGKYREKLLEELPECIITKVNDERILVASHIKPWSVSANEERVDHFNGLTLTPTYDKLFDQGFISFKDNGAILISPYISPLNVKKLNLAPGRKYEVLSHKKRSIYLTYHREKIFKQ